MKPFKPIKIKNEYGHADFGKIEIKDIPRVKKLASTYLTNAWTTIPHVTNHDEADITEMESFRSSLKDIYTGEKIKITPLYFSKNRKMIIQDKSLIPAEGSENQGSTMVESRFRSLGCMPCTGAVRSNATNIDMIIDETIKAKRSERETRIIDHGSNSMEDKKREGYF